MWEHLVYWRMFPLEYAALRVARARYGDAYTGVRTDPLVTVMIPTWNRGKLLAERTLPSILGQTYTNLEVLVVGDHCTDDTAERVAAFQDPRLKFVNLSRRGTYPNEPHARARVAGTVPANHALAVARGAWIVYSDDDDVYTPDHVEALLRFAQEHGVEFAYAACKRELTPGEWVVLQDTPERCGFDVHREISAWGSVIAHSTWCYRSYLRCFRYHLHSWRYNLAGDKSLVMRMGRAGVRAGYLDRVVTLMPLRPGDTIFSQLRFTPVEQW